MSTYFLLTKALLNGLDSSVIDIALGAVGGILDAEADGGRFLTGRERRLLRKAYRLMVKRLP